MNTLTKVLVLISATLLLSNCASIVSKSKYPYTVNTTPTGAMVIIENGKGIQVFKGPSPATVKLKAKAGFFKKGSYTVHVSSKGYDDQTIPINLKLDGWYFGNLLFGGVIGMLIVDPATGAMYKLKDEYLNVILMKSTTSVEHRYLKIYDLASVPGDWKENLIEMTP